MEHEIQKEKEIQSSSVYQKKPSEEQYIAPYPTPSQVAKKFNKEMPILYKILKRNLFWTLSILSLSCEVRGHHIEDANSRLGLTKVTYRVLISPSL